MSNHVVLRGNGFACLNCGQSYEPAMPCPINIWAASAKTFDKDHRRCKAPDVPVCGFCRAADHDDEGHVAATVKHPKDWPSCGDTGISSEAIWQHMTGLKLSGSSFGMSPPWDSGDFGRCYRLLSAPWAADWRARIGEMAKYPGWAGLAARWDELEALYREELPSGRAPKLYAAIEALRRDEGGDPMKRRDRIRTFELFQRVADGPRPYFPPNACPDCRLVDDHAGWCSRGSRRDAAAIQAGAHAVGRVNEVRPGEDAALRDEPDAERLSRARSALTSRAPTVRQIPVRSGRASR